MYNLKLINNYHYLDPITATKFPLETFPFTEKLKYLLQYTINVFPQSICKVHSV
jgi:hypothetical protein